MKSINNQHFYASQYKLLRSSLAQLARSKWWLTTLSILFGHSNLPCLPVNLRDTKSLDSSILSSLSIITRVSKYLLNSIDKYNYNWADCAELLIYRLVPGWCNVVCHYHYHYDKYNWVELGYNRSTGTRPLYRPDPGPGQTSHPWLVFNW